MSPRTLILAFVSALLAGCQSFPQPTPGMASIRIQVFAEPKAGYIPSISGSDYDFPGDGDLGKGVAFQRVDYSSLGGIIVWMESSPSSTSTPAATATIDVAAKKPTSGAAPGVSVNQRLILRNIGPQAANFYSVSDGNEFDLGSIPPGGQKDYTVRSAGLIEILSDSSSDPVAEVYAAPSKWIATGHSGSEISFMNLPPGRYKIASWHPRLPGYEIFVTLPADQVTTATIKVGVNALPKIGPR